LLDVTGDFRLQSVDGLKNLSGLRVLILDSCQALKRVDVLKGLVRLKVLDLNNCTAIPNEDCEALKAALPTTSIHLPNGDTVGPPHDFLHSDPSLLTD
jgi:hypothetical protein